MTWKVAEAKSRFSEVLRAAAGEPQLIFNRDRLVAAVIDPESYASFQRWQTRQQMSVAERFAEYRALAEDEGYAFEEPSRRDRPTRFDPPDP